MIIEKLRTNRTIRQQPGNQQADMQRQQLIGELGAHVGMEPKTIRFYESVGLLKPTRLGRFRVYGNSDAATLSLIKFLRSHDIPISSIRKIIALSNTEHNQEAAELQLAKLLGEQIERLKSAQKKIDASIHHLSEILAPESSNTH